MTETAPPTDTVLAGRYRLQRELGRGGMATVYLAEDLKHDRKVAIKVLRPELTAALGAARFQREIRIAAQLQHPHVLTVHDSGEADGLLFYVMPYVEGESLRERLARTGPLPITDVVRLLIEIAEALAHAHARGVVHRDIKPENILLSGRHALVMDFGIAKALSEAGQDASGATTGIALGTPAYMAPEQASADPALDHRADLYALGVLGYELLTGKPPFEGTPQQVLTAHLTRTPEPVGRLRSDAPAALANVIQRALTKDPAQRWQRAEDIVAALEPLAHPSGETAGITTALPAPNVAPGNRRWLAWAVPVLVLALTLVAWRAWQPKPHIVVATPPSATKPATAAPADNANPIPDIATDPSIAVLPFLDLSQAHDQEYFSEGIAEELLNQLARVPELRVVARTSSFAFKDKSVDIATIARRLHVAAVLEGSLRKSGDTVRISVQLVRAADSKPLWSETYDRKLDDVFKLQDEIAAAVVDKLKLHLLKATAPTQRTKPEAYAAYLQARMVGRQASVPALRQSLDLYRQALAIDPDYAPAWAGLANSLCYLTAFEAMSSDEGVPLAKQALDKALAADPNNVFAYATRAWWHVMADRDLQAAADDVTHALALEPHNVDALEIGDFLGRRIGRPDKAIALGEAVRVLDPINADNEYDLALAYRYAGRLDDAVATMHTALILSPGYVGGHEVIGEIRLQQGRPEEALAEMQQETDPLSKLIGLAMAYHALGKHDESNSALAELERDHAKTATNSIAYVHAFRGERDLAFQWLERALKANNGDITGAPSNPWYVSLHDDPRWLPFLRRVGVAPEQLSKIRFDVRPAGVAARQQ